MEAVLKSVTKNCRNLSGRKISLLGNPLTSEAALCLGSILEAAAYEFAFEVGLYPEVKVTIPEHTKLTRYK